MGPDIYFTALPIGYSSVKLSWPDTDFFRRTFVWARTLTKYMNGQSKGKCPPKGGFIERSDPLQGGVRYEIFHCLPIHIFICRYTLSGLPCRCTFYGNISRRILIVARIVTAYWSCAIWKHIGSMDIYLHIYLCPKYVNARTHTHMHIWENVVNTQLKSEPEPEPEPDTKQRQRSASQKPKVHAKYLRNVCFTFK